MKLENQNMINIAFAQINPLVGDIAGNIDQILTVAEQVISWDQQSDILIFPELVVTAYSPEDLLFRDDFMQEVETQIKRLLPISFAIPMIIGTPVRIEKQLFNSALYLAKGQYKARYDKKTLPNYEVFDEKRYFTSGEATCIIDIKGFKLGLIVCDDIWSKAPAMDTMKEGAQLIVSINASPFHIGKQEQRLQILKERVTETRLPFIYVNLVGGQDELVFDGCSSVINADGELLYSAPAFEEGIYHCQLTRKGIICTQEPVAPLEEEALVWQALVMGLRDYINKTQLSGAVLGLSGGIDSALSLVLAVDALGAEQITAVMMPSPYTSEESIIDAKQLAKNLNVRLHNINISPAFDVILQLLSPVFSGAKTDVTEENIQARIRGMILMALGNKYKLGVLATGNKSEMAVGYTTLYGDMAGAFAPLKDVLKTRVYKLARYYNRVQEIIPQNILDRPPSAELASGQIDSDTLPPYAVLDQVIEAVIEKDATMDDIVNQGIDKEIVNQIFNWIFKYEYKRKQAPPGVKITYKAFGKDRRYPISSGFKAY